MYIAKTLLAAAALCGAAVATPMPAVQHNQTMAVTTLENAFAVDVVERSATRPMKPVINCLIPGYAASDFGLVRVLIKNIGVMEGGIQLGRGECRQVACIRDEAAIYACARGSLEHVTIPAKEAMKAVDTVRGLCQDTGKGQFLVQGEYINHNEGWDLTVGRKNIRDGHVEGCRAGLGVGF